MKTENTTINERIKFIMESFDGEEGKFAKRIGVSKSALINVIKNNEDPSYALLRNVTTVLPVSKEWLILGKGKSFTVESVAKWKKAGGKYDEGHHAVDKAVNDRMKEIRLMQNMSQTIFASELGVTRDVISNIENDRSSPTISMLKALQKEFKINPMWIISGEKPMKKEEVKKEEGK